MQFVHAPGDEDGVYIFDYYKAVKKGYPLGKQISKTIGSDDVVAFIPKNPSFNWIDVFSYEGKYGYSIKEKRWSYGNKPPDANKIKRWIDKNWQEIHSK